MRDGGERRQRDFARFGDFFTFALANGVVGIAHQEDVGGKVNTTLANADVVGQHAHKAPHRRRKADFFFGFTQQRLFHPFAQFNAACQQPPDVGRVVRFAVHQQTAGARQQEHDFAAP